METKWYAIKNGRKDMPSKSTDLIFSTNLGQNLSGYWNAHTKTLYEYHSENGKIISTKTSLKGIFAWTILPEFGLFDEY